MSALQCNLGSNMLVTRWILRASSSSALNYIVISGHWQEMIFAKWWMVCTCFCTTFFCTFTHSVLGYIMLWGPRRIEQAENGICEESGNAARLFWCHQMPVRVSLMSLYTNVLFSSTSTACIFLHRSLCTAFNVRVKVTVGMSAMAEPAIYAPSMSVSVVMMVWISSLGRLI